MSRPFRIEYPGAWYHVMNRGLNRALIYSKPQDYSLFLGVLEEACSLFHVGVSAYCLMPNHYHLLVQTPQGNLSRFMRHVNGVYTQRFNRSRKRDGPLFRGRFKGIVVQEDAYLLQVVKYIHWNPLKARLGKSLKDYSWSSHRFFFKRKGRPEWLDTDSILSQFADRRAKAVSLYNDFMQEDLGESISQFYSMKRWNPVLGDESFVEWIKKKLLSTKGTSDVEIREKRLVRGEEQVRIINEAVCEYFRVPDERLYERRRGDKNLPRKVAVSLSWELSGLSLRELEKTYQANTYRTIATSCFRIKHEMNKDKKLAKQYKRLKSQCSQEKT